jgi:hypothetical protein
MRSSICVLFPILRCRSLHSTFVCFGLLLSFCAPAIRAQQFLLARPPAAEGPKPETSELFFETYIANIDFKFAGGELSSMNDNAGIEYDRHSVGKYTTRAGRFLDGPAKLVHARLTYVAEVLPIFLINQPIHTDIWGDALGPGRKIVPGINISPLGFRWMWLDGRAVRPLWTVKLGESLSTQKALGTNATYENFTIHSEIGFQARLTATTDLRLDYAYQHISNAYSSGSNPGLDTVGPNFGIVYHLPASSRW